MRGQDDDMVNLLKEAQETLRDFKSKQFAGADNLVVRTNQSSNSYDQSVTVPVSETGSVTLTFEADNQDYSFTDPTFEVYEGGLTPADLLFTLSNDSSPTNIDGTSGVVREVISSSTTPKRTQWVISIFNGSVSSQDYYIKAYIRASDTGTVS